MLSNRYLPLCGEPPVVLFIVDVTTVYYKRSTNFKLHKSMITAAISRDAVVVKLNTL